MYDIVTGNRNLSYVFNCHKSEKIYSIELYCVIDAMKHRCIVNIRAVHISFEDELIFLYVLSYTITFMPGACALEMLKRRNDMFRNLQ